MLQFHEHSDIFLLTPEDRTTLKSFVRAAEALYLPNPFHNFAHAVDCLHQVGRIMRLIDASEFMNELDQYVILIAAIGHDLGHPGLNNPFLLETGHELALQYNDCSPLENMHCARLYSITANKDTNVFDNLTKDQYRQARKYIINSILHTDPINHQAMVKQLRMMFQMNMEFFTGVGMPLESLFADETSKVLIIDSVLHTADISNPCRAWEVSRAWAGACLTEFFEQGDKEKALGIPTQALNDREMLSRPNSQIGFIEFMIAPLFAAQIRLWPKLTEYGDNLGHNIGNWADLLTRGEGGGPAPKEEDVTRAKGRVSKVREVLLTAASPPVEVTPTGTDSTASFFRPRTSAGGKFQRGQSSGLKAGAQTRKSVALPSRTTTSLP